MSSGRTEHQSSEELRQARDLSLEPARPPAQISGYRLQQFVGSGAYGEVWSGTDLKTGRRIAVKFYTRRNRNDVELLAREVEKLVVLSADRYVVQLLDVGWDADPPYYVMEYIQQGSLEDRLSKGQAMPVPEAVELFQEIATGMMHLHGKGILHCDLKPGNVLLDEDGRPRVADFGQSRLSTDQTPALGTLFYMAPEQADVNAIPDTSWDVYGLGALLYSMITGKPPYYSVELAKEIDTSDRIGDRLTKYRETLLKAELPTDHREIPGVDRALADIIDRSIAADPKHRFGSIQSVLLALRQRENAVARKPFMLLGVIAPILLMAVVSLFGWGAFKGAISQTTTSLTEKAEVNNFFAAQLAARSAAEQIDDYFRVVEQLARDKDFLEKFDAVIADPELAAMRMKFADPRNNVDADSGVDPMVGLRSQFAKHPVRVDLQAPLEERLFDRYGEFPFAASWFVSDRYGNQIASAFRRENRTLGSNYAYRSYFTGEPTDLNPDDATLTEISAEGLANRKVITESHLSAIFRSEQNQKWKVAISTPVIRNGEVQGIVAVTVQLGQLVDFVGEKEHYAMLVDGREGENTGTVLEHPVFKAFQKETLPDDLATAKVDLDLALDSETFRDPIGETETGKRMGYGNDSLVSIVDVTRLVRFREPDADASMDGEAALDVKPEVEREATKLFVLAVHDYNNVASDVNDLGSQLRWLGLMAGLTLLLVGTSIAFFVNRMFREARERLNRSFGPSGETSTVYEMDTLPDVRQR